jgi:hypothetical protein
MPLWTVRLKAWAWGVWLPPNYAPQTLLKSLGPRTIRGDNISSMKTSPEDDYPQLCFDVGLTCESCTAGTAGQLAAVCKGLLGRVIRQLFLQIHPHSACARMHLHFTTSYLASSSEPPAVMTAAAQLCASTSAAAGPRGRSSVHRRTGATLPASELRGRGL